MQTRTKKKNLKERKKEKKKLMHTLEEKRTNAGNKSCCIIWCHFAVAPAVTFRCRQHGRDSYLYLKRATCVRAAWHLISFCGPYVLRVFGLHAISSFLIIALAFNVDCINSLYLMYICTCVYSAEGSQVTDMEGKGGRFVSSSLIEEASDNACLTRLTFIMGARSLGSAV